MTVIPKLRDMDDPHFNPFLADDLLYGDLDDPHVLFREWRERGAVFPGDYRRLLGLETDITYPPGLQHFMVVGYEDVTEGLKKSHLFSNKPFTFNLGLVFGRSLSVMDAPEHQRYWRLLQKIFLPQNVKAWGKDIVEPVIDELMGEFIERGEADLVDQFTVHFPFRVIYRQLALPAEETAIFHKLSIGQTVVVVDREHGVEASEKLGEYFRALIAARRAQPGNDLVSLLVHAEIDGDYLPEDVLVSFFRQLVNAGGDTTYRSSGSLLAQLLLNPDQLDLLRNDRSLISNAIDEIMRFDGPILVCTRMATEDVEMSGVKIPAGAIVHFVTGAANRDPDHFPDPDRFDITRPNAGRHFGFAAGPHICIGQHLARLEMARALTAVLDRLSNLRLDPDKPAPVIKGANSRTPDHLYVKFDPPRD